MKHLVIAAAVLAAANSIPMTAAQAQWRSADVIIAGPAPSPYYPGVGPAYGYAPNTYIPSVYPVGPIDASDPTFVVPVYGGVRVVRRYSRALGVVQAYGPPGSAYAGAYPCCAPRGPYWGW